MNISIDVRQAYSEIDEFLGLLSIDKRNKVPQKLRELFSQEKDKEYIKIIDPAVPIKDQNLKEETLGLIALLNLEYWCEDEEEKERLKKVYAKNEKEYQEMLQVKFNVEDLFKKKEKDIEKEQTECVQMVQYKEPLVKKIINMIMKILKIQ